MQPTLLLRPRGLKPSPVKTGLKNAKLENVEMSEKNDVFLFHHIFTYFLRMLRVAKGVLKILLHLPVPSVQREIAILCLNSCSCFPSILMCFKAFYNICYPTEYFLLPLTP